MQCIREAQFPQTQSKTLQTSSEQVPNKRKSLFKHTVKILISNNSDLQDPSCID